MRLQLHNVSCQFNTQPVLQDICMTLQSGCTALIGPNGAGKSTLLRLCAGEGRFLHNARTTGQILLDDVALGSIPLTTLARRRSFLPQQHAEHLHGPVKELLCLAAYPHGGGGERAVLLYNEALALWELETLAERHYDQLSGGERQRVQLARTWLQMRLHTVPEERFWLLDEPQTALDLPHQQRLRKQLQQEASQGACIIFSTHDINFALRTAERLIVLDTGKICADGDARTIADKNLLQSVFGVSFHITPHPVDGRPWVMAE